MLATSHHSSCCGQILASLLTFPLIPLLHHPLYILLPQAQKHCIHVKGQTGIQGRWDAGLLDLGPLQTQQHLSTSHLKVMMGIVQARSEVSQHKASRGWSQKTGTHWSSFPLSGTRSVKHQKATPQVSQNSQNDNVEETFKIIKSNPCPNTSTRPWHQVPHPVFFKHIQGW